MRISDFFRPGAFRYRKEYFPSILSFVSSLTALCWSSYVLAQKGVPDWSSSIWITFLYRSFLAWIFGALWVAQISVLILIPAHCLLFGGPKTLVDSPAWNAEVQFGKVTWFLVWVQCLIFGTGVPFCLFP